MRERSAVRGPDRAEVRLPGVVLRKEKRSIGGATPGLDGVAKLRMNVRPITSSEHLSPATLDEFERDIRFALKEHFGQLVSSREWTNSFGNHCLEVVVRGTMEDIPLEWHYYLVVPESGNRVSIAVTIQGEMVNRLATADRQLVNAIEFVPSTPATQTATTVGPRR